MAISSIVVEDKPKLFSKVWFSNFFNAFNFKKYGAKEWMIWNLSSWATWIQFAIGAKLFSMIPPGVVAAWNAVWAKAVYVATATVVVVGN